MKLRSHLLILFAIFAFIYISWSFLLLALDGKIFGSETFEIKEYTIDELKNSTITFDIDKLVLGKHDLEVHFVTYDPYALQNLPNPINFELTLQIQNGNETKEKPFVKTFINHNSLAIFYLFDVPKDFIWSSKAKTEVTIKDIRYDEEFPKYFKKVVFVLKRLQLLGHNINMVDGERIYRKNGFRKW